MPEHALRRINVEKRRAVCAVCGPVKIRSRGDGGWRCATALNEYKRRRRAVWSVRVIDGPRTASAPLCS